MAFNDWQDTANVESLTLPIRDRDGVRREYTIPPLGYLDGIKLREETARIREDGPAAATMSNEEFLKLILAGQLYAMRDDNVPPAAIIHAASVAHTDALHGRIAAERLWNEGPDPEALAAALEEMKAAVANSTTSPATDEAASSTKPPANTSGTTSPKKKPPARTGTRSSPAPS